jgi:cation-transporting P-type ATPase E
MWSGASFENAGTWVMGAPEHLLRQDDSGLQTRASEYARTGSRVIVLASSDEMIVSGSLPEHLNPRALILLSDVIRPEAKPALDFFTKNDVEIKIITGDSPLTAAAIAEKLGLEGAGRMVDMSVMPDDPEQISRAARDFTVFGRVSPGRKKQLVSALQKDGKIVAMTGDGTNDVLAMHQADCSIVMASGSPAAKAMAHIALLDSDFTVLPAVVSEGRQVINNVERVAGLYLVKTTFSIILSVFFILIGASYFFFPIHQTLLGMVSIGIPSFILAMEKNIRRVQPGFLGKVIRTAIPGGVTIAVNLMALKLLHSPFGIDMSQARLIAVMITGIAGLLVLLRVSLPLNRLRVILLLAMTLVFFTVVLFFPGSIELPALEAGSIYMVLAFGAVTCPMMLLIKKLLDRI